jgi:hypothetical protein
MNFKAGEILISDFKKGWLPAEAISKEFYPEGFVSNCRNLDISQFGISPRFGYGLEFKFPDTFTNEYKIINFYKYPFYDDNGNSKDILILVIYDYSENRFRIYSKGYYCPDNLSFDNYYNSQVGFNNDFIELTEYYPINLFQFQTGIYEIGDIIYNFKCNNQYFNDNQAMFQQDYFKGFYTFDVNFMCGFVENSIIYGNELYIKAAINYNVTPEEISITRFPVTHYYHDFFYPGDNYSTDYNKVFSFDHYPNLLKIYTGSKPLQIQFIKNRISYQKPIIGNVTYHNLHTKWLQVLNYTDEESATYHIRAEAMSDHGIMLSYKKSELESYTPFYMIPFGEKTDTIRQAGGAWLHITSEWDDWLDPEEADFTVSNTVVKWDGFWFDFDNLRVSNKKIYEHFNTEADGTFRFIGNDFRELGIDIKLSPYLVSTAEKYDAVYAFAVKIDDFQTIYLKSALCGSKKRLDGYLYLMPYFNRRISGFMMFGYEGDGVVTKDTHDNVLPETNLFKDNIQGFIKFKNKVFFSNNDNFHTDILSHTVSVYDNAKDISLQKLLNQDYWKETAVECISGINLGSSNLVFGLSSNFIKIDEDSLKIRSGLTGKLAFCLSQIQDGTECHSVFSTERIYELSVSDIVSLVQTVGNQFLLFSKTGIRWYNITDLQKMDITEIGSFESKYRVDFPTDIVKATYVENASYGTASWEFGAKEFGGIFFKNEESIFYFKNNKPIDLLEFTWKEFYQSLDKTGSISGYYPDTSEYWIKIGSVIFIYSLIHKNWKIYDFRDVPVVFHHFSDGIVYFLNSDNELLSYNAKKKLLLDKDLYSIPCSFDFWTNLKAGNAFKDIDSVEVFTDTDLLDSEQDTPYTVIIKNKEDYILLNTQFDFSHMRNFSYLSERIPNDCINFSFDVSYAPEEISNISDFKFNAVLFKYKTMHT